MAGTGATGSISLIAGAAFTVSGSTVTITGNSSTGGVVDTHDITNYCYISTGVGDMNMVCGDINIIAFAGNPDPSGNTLGTINIAPNTSVTTAATGTGSSSGNITMLAGAQATGLSTGSITSGFFTTYGGYYASVVANQGNVNISTATPVLSAPAGQPFQIVNGALASGDSFTAGALQTGAGTNITISSTNTNNASGYIAIAAGQALNVSTGTTQAINNAYSMGSDNAVSLYAGGALTTGGISATGNVVMYSPGALSVNGGVSVGGPGKNIEIASAHDITLGSASNCCGIGTQGSTVPVGSTPPVGGNIAVVAGGGITSNGISVITSAGNAPNVSGGSINFVAGANFSLSTSTSSLGVVVPGNSITITANGATADGGSATGGQINLGSIWNGIASNGYGIGITNGGDQNFIAFYGGGTGANAGTVTMATNNQLNSYGNSGGTNGNITILAGAPSVVVGVSPDYLTGSIQTGRFSTYYYAGGGSGNVNISTATPVLYSGSGNQVQITNGALASGNAFTAGALQTRAGTNITISSWYTNNAGGYIAIAAGQALSISTGTSQAINNAYNMGSDNAVSLYAGGALTTGGVIANGNVLMYSPGALSVNGPVSVGGGNNIEIASASDITLGSTSYGGGVSTQGSTIPVGSTPPVGGSIAVVAGGGITSNGNSGISSAGNAPNASGGSINFVAGEF